MIRKISPLRRAAERQGFSSCLCQICIRDWVGRCSSQLSESRNWHFWQQFIISHFYSHRIHGAGIYTNIGGILMGSMLPYIAAPWIRHGITNFMKHPSIDSIGDGVVQVGGGLGLMAFQQLVCRLKPLPFWIENPERRKFLGSANINLKRLPNFGGTLDVPSRLGLKEDVAGMLALLWMGMVTEGPARSSFHTDVQETLQNLAFMRVDTGW